MCTGRKAPFGWFGLILLFLFIFSLSACDSLQDGSLGGAAGANMGTEASATPTPTETVASDSGIPTEPPAPELTPTPTAIPPASGRLVFSSYMSGNDDIYVINTDGSGLFQVTNDPNKDVSPSWSPEGFRIAFQAFNGLDLNVYSFDLKNDKRYLLSDYVGPDSAPTWGCGGSQIAFTSVRDGNPNLFEVFWQGGLQENLTINPASDKWSQWSPSKEPASRGR